VVRKFISDGSGSAVIAIEQESGNVAALLVAPGVVRGLAEKAEQNGEAAADLSVLVAQRVEYVESARGIVTYLRGIVTYLKVLTP
jgi:hypothetical protein